MKLIETVAFLESCGLQWAEATRQARETLEKLRDLATEGDREAQAVLDSSREEIGLSPSAGARQW